MTWFRTLLGLLACGTIASAGDWPQWRGPNRDGHSADTALLGAWPADGPKLLWSLTDADKVGTGYGSPAVVGNRMYIIGADGAKQTAAEFVTCLDLKDGNRVWRQNLETTPGKFSDGWGGGPRSTPTVDGDALYVLGVTGDLVCLGAEKGDIRWSKNLVKDYGGGIPIWGYSESPLVDGDKLLVTPGNKGGMIALDKRTGKTVWQCKELTDGAAYSSILVTEVGGVRQYVQQTMASGVGVRASDGKLLWKVGGIGRRTAVIPTPVLHDNYVFFTAGYGAGCECFKLEKDGDGTKATEVYTKNKVVANHHGGVVRVGDYIYGHSDSSGWVCFDMKKGGDEAVWQNKGVGKGSVSFADGFLYCYSENDGTLARVKAAETGYVESGKFAIPQKSKLRPKQGKVWAHPVIAGGRLILRDYELLFVYDVRKPKA
ncbi:outer membrane biogenesis protein BamB [Gemmata obscuriglobus]|uniref:Polyvinylalcohol dehydrogenase n=1 Tax=Gemmata obscuriglobus TaxID=114 RepID=A0A2Z3HBI7_9BACT|nr:PQQ-binding-like beta-propeller repeat protein [Gemmata obscuriglobus]AWM39004.1 polyvinylalcohol dehydrogenase [Gemmata obscuriglobus]QEG27972.1 outer membrane biogenesis protein BamB [Gemmata obscuriglobus]VTS05470.1 Pyrrolo-quinoline quinone OS=Chthoniobacter flavus Ellin428 GN=CfE428DRAFT_4660 PE=4 SV=1: PQQ_2 [Gemmata obscuriglobus UQM 2246]